MKKILTFWLTALMLLTMLMPTSLAALDVAQASAEGTEETTAAGADEGAAKSEANPAAEAATAVPTANVNAVQVTNTTAVPKAVYPTSIDVRDEGAEIRKTYDLAPDADPAGIPRADFEHAGFYYTFVDLLKQELPEYEERTHTESLSLNSKKKDMESILELLPKQKEFVTDDGLSGILDLKLDTVQAETAGYGKSTKQVSVTRNYPNQVSQDTENIPKSIDDSGTTLTLADIKWQTDNTANVNGYAMGDRFTAVATYTGTATSTYVKGYTVTADYTGTVSRIALNRVRYVAIFEGMSIFNDTPDLTDTSDLMEPSVALTAPAEPEKPTASTEPDQDVPDTTETPENPEPEAPATAPPQEPQTPSFSFNWAYILVPLLVIVLAGIGFGIALFIKHRTEDGDDSD